MASPRQVRMGCGSRTSCAPQKKVNCIAALVVQILAVTKAMIRYHMHIYYGRPCICLNGWLYIGQLQVRQEAFSKNLTFLRLINTGRFGPGVKCYCTTQSQTCRTSSSNGPARKTWPSLEGMFPKETHHSEYMTPRTRAQAITSLYSVSLQPVNLPDCFRHASRSSAIRQYHANMQ